MVTPSGSCPAGSPVAATLAASENGLYVAYTLELCGSQVFRASANVAPSGIWSGGKPEAASSRPLKLKKDTRAVISQIACSFHPTFRSDPISSLSTRLGVSVSLLA